MKQPTGCFNCVELASAKDRQPNAKNKANPVPSPDIRYGYASPIYVGRNGHWYKVDGTCASCNHCGYSWTMYEYPPNGV